jgi:ubiquinol-cytochrome c reductase cytochrome b subunit
VSVLTWIEQRTGLVGQIGDFLTEDVPGGASYWYVFGSATVFAMILQIVTGIFLTFYYAPSTASAWESTKYIYEHVPFGSFVISLHFWGATAMIAMLLMHMLQVIIWGAYKAPREIMWVIGVLLLIITLVLGLTGYLLPWDMNAYFASQVAINISASVPVLGGFVQQFLSGGAGMGTLTINRFFGLHVWLMPAALIALVAGHLAIFRHNGSAGPPVDTELKKLPQGRFWPNQMFMDAAASFAVFAIMVLLAIFVPAPIDAKADPTQKFIAYPAWYFLALYGLLRIAGSLPPSITPIANLLATVVIPGVVVTVLILLPWIDRNPSRLPQRRPIVLGITAISVLAAVVLSIYSQLAVQQEQAESGPPAAAVASSTTGTTTGPASGGGAASTTVAAAGPGAAVYSTNCSGCHGASGMGQAGVFPPLAKNDVVTGDKGKVITILLKGLNNVPIVVNGSKYAGVMPAWKGTLKDADIAAVLTYIRSSWGNSAPAITEAEVKAADK